MVDAPSGRSLRERLEDAQLIKQALARGVREALWRHKRLGNPICVWEDNKVVWIAPEDIQVEPDSMSGSTAPPSAIPGDG